MSPVKTLFRVNHVLVALFALASGVFKIAGGRADVELFSHIGMSATAVAIFGVVQALGGVALLPRLTSRFGAAAVAICNGVATVGLFVAGVQPFGAISIVFIVMAIVALLRGRSEAHDTSGPSAADHDPRIGAARAHAHPAPVRPARDAA